MNELVLHSATQKHLQQVTQQPPHALLLVAPAGAGKQAVAHQLAADLLGVTPVELMNNPAFLVADVPEDTAIGIDFIRQIQHFMSLRSLALKQGVNRIAYLPDAQRMTREAQNALLKLLEEPPVGSMFLLTAISPSALLPTVLSRCHTLQLRKPTSASLIEHYQAGGYSGKDIQLALSMSGGWPGLASQLLDPSQEHPLALAAQTARQLLGQSAFERLASVDAMAKQRQQSLDTCYILQQMAHLALQKNASERWQRILRAAYDCQLALERRANSKLALTQLMLGL